MIRAQQTTVLKRAPRKKASAINGDGPPRPVGDAGCPLCGGRSDHHLNVPGHGEMRRCVDDGLIFASPMALPATPHELFGLAYSGDVSDAEMQMFHHRMQWRADLLANGLSPLVALPDVHHRALAEIKRDIRTGEAVLDIGCGSGLFLDVLRRAGYHAYGIEVAEPVVKFHDESGFEVFHGTVEEAPDGWVDPAVCTAFFVLHHVTDPIGFLKSTREKYPRAPLILTEHYFGTDPERLGPLNVPPRRLTAWNPNSLRKAVEIAGYRVRTIEVLEAEAYHPRFDGSLTRTYCRLRPFIPSPLRARGVVGYIRAKRAVCKAMALVIGKNPLVTQEHLLAVAEPA